MQSTRATKIAFSLPLKRGVEHLQAFVRQRYSIRGRCFTLFSFITEKYTYCVEPTGLGKVRITCLFVLYLLLWLTEFDPIGLLRRGAV